MHMFILLGLLIGVFAEDCPANSHYNDCGSACPITCENYENPPTFCIRICVPGCHCDEKNGYVKTKDGRCVLPKQCQQTEEQSCLAQPDEGLCRGYFDMYYYDAKKGDCFKFIYGGCGGNGNKYATYDDCMSKCGDVKVWESESDVCRLSFESGTGDDYVTRYGFNNALGACTKFVYTGEGGNGNNFKSLQECRRACEKDVKVLESESDVCRLSFESGTGDNYVTRYGFNNALGECTKFVYTGEGGNGNNFKSLQECRRACEKTQHLPTACQQEKDVGMCKALIPRYFYNQATGECEHFVYGGCQGNSNNFMTKDDCEAVCKA